MELEIITILPTVTVKMIFGSKKSSADINTYRDEIKNSLNKVDFLMSTYRSDSEVSILNNLPVGQLMSVSPQTYEVLSVAQNISRMTEGVFDITIGPLVDLWGFGPEYKGDQIPSEQSILAKKKDVNWQAILLDNGQVKKTNKVSVDLSAIAKGYAVDQVAKTLKELNVTNYLVEVGGEISVSGLNIRQQPWVLGIEQPDIAGRKLHKTIHLKDKSLATSGDYRNYFEKNGVRYSHTINPTSGYPIEHKLASVSVIADTCTESDAIATSLMVMGEVQGYEFALKEGIDAYFIYRENESFNAIYTPGFKPYLN